MRTNHEERPKAAKDIEQRDNGMDRILVQVTKKDQDEGRDQAYDLARLRDETTGERIGYKKVDLSALSPDERDRLDMGSDNYFFMERPKAVGDRRRAGIVDQYRALTRGSSIVAAPAPQDGQHDGFSAREADVKVTIEDVTAAQDLASASNG